ncbi:MAG TPA: hypothetical protein DIS94_11250, partial [Bacteroidetes bacterium]|nr:hypothetical protein [Bacteroidota bacterium]
LIKIQNITQNKKFEDIIEKSLNLFFPEIGKSSFSYPETILALLNYIKKNTEIIFTGSEIDIRELKNYIMGSFIPFKLMLKANSDIEKISPLINNESFKYDIPNVYICKDFKCEKPVNNLEEIKKIIL